jgi:hypothetical protein
MRLIDTHRLLLVEVVMMVSRESFGRARGLWHMPAHPEDEMAIRHTTNAGAIRGAPRALSR